MSGLGVCRNVLSSVDGMFFTNRTHSLEEKTDTEEERTRINQNLLECCIHFSIYLNLQNEHGFLCFWNLSKFSFWSTLTQDYTDRRIPGNAFLNIIKWEVYQSVSVYPLFAKIVHICISFTHIELQVKKIRKIKFLMWYSAPPYPLRLQTHQPSLQRSMHSLTYTIWGILLIWFYSFSRKITLLAGIQHLKYQVVKLPLK